MPKWGADWRDKEGNLIVRQGDIPPPVIPTCIKLSCVWKYFIESLTYAAIGLYETRRVEYATRNRGKKILERYRTGEPRPKTLWEAIHANIKLTCPLCRKYNVDPFLFRR